MSRSRVPVGEAERFWAKVNKEAPNGCWEWMAGLYPNGYGQFWAGKQVRAHRWSYEQARGEIPEGLQIDHLCRNKICVNPDHLEAVSQLENIRRGVPFRKPENYRFAPGARNPSARRTPFGVPTKSHCVHGHEYNPENTAVNRDGTVYCRTCVNKRHRERYHRQKLHPDSHG